MQIESTIFQPRKVVFSSDYINETDRDIPLFFTVLHTNIIHTLNQVARKLSISTRISASLSHEEHVMQVVFALSGGIHFKLRLT